MSTADDARFWDRAARRYAKARIGDERGYERTLERTRALLAPEARVLELGCGTGSTALRLAGGVARYLATDISEKMIGIAQDKHAQGPIPGLEFRVATAESIAAEREAAGSASGREAVRSASGREAAGSFSGPEAAGSASGPEARPAAEGAEAQPAAEGPERFDAVLGFNYLHLVRDPQTALRHVHDLLRRGGLFISKTPCLGDMNVLVRGALLPAMRAVGLAPHVAVFGAQDLVELIRGAGFEIVATERHGTKGRDVRPFVVARKP